MTRSRRILRAALLAALAFTPAEIRAARLPDWAEEAAQAAPSVPPGVSDTPSRVLLSEVRYLVQPDGSFRIRRRLALQAMSVNTEKVDTGWFHFDDTMRVTASRAWHLPPGESAKRSHSESADIAVGDAFLTGAKTRLVPVEGVKRGSLVFFEFEATEKPYFLALGRLFYEGAPVLVDRLEMSVPRGWNVRSAWLRQNGPDPVVNGDLRTWELRDLPAPRQETMGTAPENEAPFLALNVLPTPGTKVGPAEFPDWDAVAAWFDNLSRGRADVTPAIQATLKQALPAGISSFAARVRAPALFVRDRVRYVAVDLGIGGYQPRPASDTLARLYGDCKDKTTLLRSLLTVEGIESYPVLVNALIPETVPESPPFPGFNHLVLAVPIAAGETVSPSMATAVVEAGDLGRLLIVDVTDENTSIGSISPELAGKRALVAAGSRGRLVTLPEGDAGSHRVVRRVKIELLPDRTVRVERASSYAGEFAASARAEAGISSRDRRRAVEGRTQELWPDTVVEDYESERETAEGEFVETIQFRHGPLPASGADARVEFFPGAFQDLARVPLAKRKDAVVYPFPRTIRYEVSLKGIPERASLPAPESIGGDGWKIATTYAREGDRIQATWELQLSRTRFAPEAFPELKKLWAAVSSTSGWSAPLSN